MSTVTSFQDMLNQYLPNDLLKEELVQRDYVLSTVEIDDSWKGGPLIVPFRGAGASSIAYGALTASDDVSEDDYVRGQVDGPAEAWGTMKFNHRDLMEHGSLSEQNFLKLLPDTVDDFIDRYKNVVSTNLLNGSNFDTLTADATNLGAITVKHPDRYELGQKVYVADDDTAATFGYVRSINMETQVIVLYNARSGGAVVDLSAYTLAENAKCYFEGAQANSFSSIRSALLSNANGGSAALYGQTKLSYPYLQAVQVSGAASTKVTLLSDIFNALVKVCKIGKGKPTEVLMSLTNLGYCMQIIESQKGSFNVVPNSQKVSQYGWMEIMVGSVTKGMLKLVGIQEAEDDVIMLMDWRAIKFYSNGFFQKRKSPSGNEYFEVRATTGYYYLVDICLFGELVVQRPSYCGIIYGIAIA